MKKYNTAEEITNAFHKEGLSKATYFTEVALEEAEEKGYSFIVDGMQQGRKYFKISISGNIYDDSGKLVLKISCIKNTKI